MNITETIEKIKGFDFKKFNWQEAVSGAIRPNIADVIV